MSVNNPKKEKSPDEKFSKRCQEIYRKIDNKEYQCKHDFFVGIGLLAIAKEMFVYQAVDGRLREITYWNYCPHTDSPSIREKIDLNYLKNLILDETDFSSAQLKERYIPENKLIQLKRTSETRYGPFVGIPLYFDANTGSLIRYYMIFVQPLMFTRWWSHYFQAIRQLGADFTPGVFKRVIVYWLHATLNERKICFENRKKIKYADSNDDVARSAIDGDLVDSLLQPFRVWPFSLSELVDAFEAGWRYSIKNSDSDYWRKMEEKSQLLLCKDECRCKEDRQFYFLGQDLPCDSIERGHKENYSKLVPLIKWSYLFNSRAYHHLPFSEKKDLNNKEILTIKDFLTDYEKNNGDQRITLSFC